MTIAAPSVERFFENQQIYSPDVRAVRERLQTDDFTTVKGHILPCPPTFQRVLGSHVIDQDLAHDPSSGGFEVSLVQLLHPTRIDELRVRLVYERCRVQSAGR